jgi:DMSO/TMAO reductase YedYZ molybdopterin-dependent catalytic subunit
MAPDRLSRRDLLRLGLLAGGASALTACGWQGGPLQPLLKKVGEGNDWLSQRLLLSPTTLAREYPLSERTPAKDFPAYSLVRPYPQLTDPAAYALEVRGEVAKPVRLTLPMIQALPRLTYTVKHHCVEGWSAIGTWTGAPLASIFALVQPTAAARFLRFDSFDRGYSNGWDLESAVHPQTILAYAFNDQPLTPSRGAPLRLYSPIKLGYKMTKYLTVMTFTAGKHGGFWEDQGYPWFGGI